MNWDKLLNEEIEAPFIPKLKGDNELKYFNVYPDSDDGNLDSENNNAEVLGKDDPFVEWFK